MRTKRILYDLLLVLGLTLLAQVIYYALLIVSDTFEYFWEDLKAWPRWLLVDFAWCFLVATVAAMLFFWRRTILERERNKYHLQALDNQLSPHFVFNNFSILADLIEVDPQRASSYLMNLTKVYRYALSHLDHDTVTLQEELEFMQHYLALLKQRFGGSIDVRIADDVSAHKGSLPPAALQILIENAIKHNEHTETCPLVINVTADDHHVFVSNNKQPMTAADSVHLGQQNLVERYRLLTWKKVSISDTPDNYCVTIPLITT